MTRLGKHHYKIVVGIDLSEYADIVIEHALDQAARHEAPELHFLTVREKRSVSSAELEQRLWARICPPLQAFSAYGENWRARLHVRRGKPEDEIAALAAELAADLIVIGQFGLHRHGVPSAVLAGAVCPTLVVGMPKALDGQCPMCALVRDDSDGERWFCVEHLSPDHLEHRVSVMTAWTAGNLQQ